uniref:Uncharacterized protein n=1 Tax=Rhizophora mucronata TaxID=61149 RepID=A0A2P2QGD4_RHIMU
MILTFKLLKFTRISSSTEIHLFPIHNQPTLQRKEPK